MKIKFINGESIDVDSVKKLERSLRVDLPNDYVEFITQNNGAYVLPNAFKVGGKIESINNFYKIQDIHQFIDERLPNRVIPIARDAGGNKICLDLIHHPTASPIFFWDYELEEKVSLSLIAKSFTDFLDILFDFDE